MQQTFLEPTVVVAIIGGVFGLVGSLAAWAGHRNTRRTAAEGQSLSVLQAALARLDAEVTRLGKQVEQLTTDVHKAAGAYKKALAHIRALTKQLTGAGVEPAVAPAEIAGDI